MTVISVGQLRQHPAAVLGAVELGKTYTVTRYRRPIARLVPETAASPSGTEITHFSHQFKAEHPGTSGFTQSWLNQHRESQTIQDPWAA
jgi:antitoxin (DNA-binding transcriptional repressor) of toxin-antitoxin stability system